MNLEGVMLSRISKTQKEKYCIIFTFMRFPEGVKFFMIESRMVVSGLGIGGIRKLLYNRYRVSDLQDEKVLQLNSGDDCTNCEFI